MQQNAKHFLSVFGLVLAGTMLSGCSLLPERLAPSNANLPLAFQTKPTVGSLWKSTDGGETFEPRITVDEKTKITTADILALSFLEKNPNGATMPTEAPEIYAGTVETGIFRTKDGAETWEHIAFPPKKIYSFIIDRVDSARMFATGVIGKRGELFRTEDSGENWRNVYTEPGEGTLVLSLIQHVRDTGVILAGTSAGTVVKSTDRGNTWKNVGQRIDGPVTRISFDAVKPKSVYALAFQKKVWYSDNGGEQWIDWEEEKQKELQACRERHQSFGIGKNDPCAEISDPSSVMPSSINTVLADPSKSGRIWAGTTKGLFVSDDHGKNWKEVNIIESARQFPIRAIAVHPRNPAEVVFVAGKALYKSVNTGETWSVVQLNIDREVSVLEYDPFNHRTLYFGLRKY